jgi:hypothetical protein
MRTSWSIGAHLLWTALHGIWGLGPGVGPARAQALGSISGQVVELIDSGPVPVAGARVTALGDRIPVRVTTTTGLDGRYTISGLPPGGYRLVSSRPDPQRPYFNSYFRLGASTLAFREASVVLLLAGQDLSGRDIRLFPRSDFEGSISGLVRRSADGVPVTPGLVTVRAAFSDFSDTVFIGPDGRYRVERLAPGNYFVTATASGYARQIYPRGLFYQDASAVPVPSPPLGAPVTGIDFALAPGGSIEGSVRRQSDPFDQVPLAQVGVFHDSGRLFAVTIADGLGDYRVDFLPLGSYRVAAWIPRSQGDNLAFEFYQDASSFGAATPVVLSAPAPAAGGIDLSLPDGGVLQGTVTDDQGQPLAGALVLAQPEQNPLGLNLSALSAGDGTYRIDKLTAGRYLVQAGAAGKIREFYDNALIRQRASPVAVAEGAATSGIDLELEAGRRLTGAVKLGTIPLLGVRLVLRSDLADFTQSVRSQSNGEFVFEGLPPLGDYRLVALALNAAPRQIFPVDLRSSDQRVEVNLEAGYSLGGRIFSNTGTALANAVVELSHPRIPRSLSMRTDEGGRFLFEHLPSIAGYRLVAGAPGYARTVLTNLSLEAGNQLNVNLSLGPGRSLSGRVTLEGSPLAGIRVTAHSSSSGSSGSVRTREDGTYTIEGLAAAQDYLVVAGRDALQVMPYPGRVNLTSGNATGIDIDIPVGRSVSGTVTSGASPVARARVVAWSPSVRRGGIGITDIQGTYSIANLPAAGDYRLLALQRGFAPQFYLGAASAQDATPVDLMGGSAGGVDFDLSPGVTLSGTVRSAAGAAVPEAFVTVTAASKIVASGRTNLDGLFETTPVAPGTYDVIARAAAEPGRAQLLGVAVGSEPLTGLQLSFGQGGTIEGTVRLAGGGDPSQALVVVFRHSDQSFVQLTQVSSSGTYRIGGLPPDSYFVTARAEEYLPRAYSNALSLAEATPIQLGADAVVTGIDFDLPADPNGPDGAGGWLAGAGLVISSFSASPGLWTSAAQLTIGWEPVEDANGYNAVFDTSEITSVPNQVTLEPGMTSVASEPLEDGIFYAHVRSFVLEIDPGTGLPIGYVSEEDHAGPFLLDTTPPPSPDGLSSSADSGQITLNWLDPTSDPGGSGLDRIQLQRDELLFPGSPSEGQLMYQNNVPEAGQPESFTDTSVIDGQPYYYSVFAIDAAGNVSIPGAQISDVASPLGEDINAPATPSSLAAATTETEVILQWKNPPDPDLQGIEVRHSSQGYPRLGYPGQVLARLSGNPNQVMTYVHVLPGPGPHYYSIYAYDAVPNYSDNPAEIFAFLAGQVPASGDLALGLSLLALFGAGAASLLQRRRLP